MVFLRFDLEHFGLERSGRSVGFISTYSGTYTSPWCRVMTKKPQMVTTIKGHQNFLKGFKGFKGVIVLDDFCRFLNVFSCFSLDRVVLYTVFMFFPSPKSW